MNNLIFIPAKQPEDWRHLLAEPAKHWRDGYSAKSLALSWQSNDGFPPEVRRVFENSDFAIFRNAELLLAIPEHQVPLPGGGKPSQNDLFVLAKGVGQLISLTVEGKASEPFGPLVSDWFKTPSDGRNKRLTSLCKTLELNPERIQPFRYQLLHRTASSVIEAQRFNAQNALMMVHSFSPINEGFDDFKKFAGLYNAKAEPDKILYAGQVNGIDLYLGWVKGEIPMDQQHQAEGTVPASKYRCGGHHEIDIREATGNYRQLAPSEKIMVIEERKVD
jgi:hypothetical protein